MITLPLVGDVPAAGKTPQEVASVVAQAVSRFQKEPTVTVAVEEIHSYRIYLLGNLGAQQSLESSTPLRLLQAIAAAGGLNEFASKKILVLRDENGKQTVREVDYDKIIKGKAPDQNIWLRSGDVVIAR
ncbi:MAG: polysaccharide biosynthesis/export family protein [Acidobacteriota bacterium]|nr:polysaccharide biosynthesis/export family protein [Acidobacteriota bacterium]